MKRIQLFEFEDFNWFPSSIRTSMTNLIVVLQKMMGTPDVLAERIAAIRSKVDFDQIVDMGSGSGGAMPMVHQKLKESGHDVNVLLTDLHPNEKLVKKFNSSGSDKLSYSKDSLDATDLSKAPAGLKTMFNSFHHMPPEKARSILKSAKENQEPIFIYELTENKMPTMIWWLFLPISLTILIVMTLFMTPMARPMTWQQLVFTYLIPIIPICYAWDGQASYVRTYTFDDIRQLLEGLEDESYAWEISPAGKANGKKAGYYILGVPN